jgi:maltooligosyltrehalose trehalohydrolase
VLSEVHIGTFSPEGTYAAAATKLALLADAGINVIELMPVNEFAGRFGWGYDGVDLWAPTSLYGHPDDLRAFVDAAHEIGLAVVLDVVYNHLGPDGNYLAKFTPSYFTGRYENEWGDAVNFDGEDSAGVRELVRENAAHWIDEYHFDGLRIDATQTIHDRSARHIVAEIAAAARCAAGARSIYLVAENEPQDTILVREYGLDSMWNDDWHHAAMVALTGRSEAYYSDYSGRPQEFVSMATLGFLYQGQWYSWQKKRRGTPSHDLMPEQFVVYVQNHDQIANSAHGQRVHELTSPGRYRAMTALTLLSPQTPMLFQGQEFAASARFLYFADHDPELAAQVAKGRKDFLRQFRSLASEEMLSRLDLPHDVGTFEKCRIDWSERAKHAEALELHRDLLRLRREDVTISRQRAGVLRGAVIGENALALRWFAGGAGDRLLVVNLGGEFPFSPAGQPLLAAPADFEWIELWSSEAPGYGGSGAQLQTAEGWRIPAESAALLKAAR